MQAVGALAPNLRTLALAIYCPKQPIFLLWPQGRVWAAARLTGLSHVGTPSIKCYFQKEHFAREMKWYFQKGIYST